MSLQRRARWLDRTATGSLPLGFGCRNADKKEYATMSMTSRALKLLAIATFTAASSMSLLGTATASPQPPATGGATVQPSTSHGCAYGTFCVYDKDGNKMFATASDWSSSTGFFGGYSYFNNAKPMPGYDHVDLTYRWPLGDGRYVTGRRCIHLGHPEGLGDFDQDEVWIMQVRWRGEC